MIVAVALAVMGACSSKGSAVVKLTFVRSGGVAGPMMRVEGAVDFDGDKATVKSDARKYQRDLDANEARDLQKAADPASWPKASSVGGGDAFQYDVTVTMADGTTHKVRLYDQSSTPLSTWLKEESGRIFSSK